MIQKTSLEISNRYSRLDSPEGATAKLFEQIIESGKFPIGGGELSIAFVDDAIIGKVHADFMGDPSPTDVITFPADPEMESAGEIIVSVDHAQLRAAELGEPFSKELSLYLIHGWLHLAGFDDHTDVDQVAMRAAEQEALALLELPETQIAFLLKDEA